MVRPPVIDSARERKKRGRPPVRRSRTRGAYSTAIAPNARVCVVKRCEERKDPTVSSPPHAVFAARALPAAYQLYFLGAARRSAWLGERWRLPPGSQYFRAHASVSEERGTRHNTSSAADGNTLERAATSAGAKEKEMCGTSVASPSSSSPVAALPRARQAHISWLSSFLMRSQRKNILCKKQ